MTISRNQWQGAAWIVVLSGCFFALARFFTPTVPAATQWIVVWSAIESIAALYGLCWAFQRSDKLFFAMFFGGTLFRLASLGVIAALLCARHIPLMVPLLSLAFLYFFFSLLQVPFVTYGFW